jgi:hypothetical protein
MQVHLEQVLTAAGLPADQVKALVELPADAPEFKADVYTTPILTGLETKVINDPKFYEKINKENLPQAFLKTLEQEQYGRAASQVRANVLKASGLTEKDFEALGEEGKKIDVFTPAFLKKVTEGKVTDKELQQKLIDAHKELEDLKGATPELEKKYKSEADQRVADYQFQSGVLTSLASVQGLKAPAKYLASGIIASLRGKYAFEIVDGEPELRQKENPTLKVLVDNKPLTLAGAITALLEADSLVEKKGTKTTTSTAKVEVEGDGGKGLKIHSGVKAKMDKRLAEDAKLSGQA